MILDMFKLTGRVAIVTGAGQGIGRGIARAFAEAGAHVVCAARTQKDIEAVAEYVGAQGVKGLPVVCDVTDEKSLDNLVAKTLREFGRIDILVNSAGGTGPMPALDTTAEYFEAAFRFNLLSAFLLSQKVIPHMVATAGEGSIVNISSRASDMVQTSFVAYGSMKAALNMMTRNMAAEIAPKVRMNAISVGGVATDSLKVVLTNEHLAQMFNDNTPMHRPGEPEDIAAAALYLASPASAWVTGKIFQVDGGTNHPSISVPVPPL